MALLSIPRLITGCLKETHDPSIYQYTKHVISKGSNSLWDSIHLRVQSIQPRRFVTLPPGMDIMSGMPGEEEDDELGEKVLGRLRERMIEYDDCVEDSKLWDGIFESLV